jgi:hypothetical protein
VDTVAGFLEQNRDVIPVGKVRPDRFRADRIILRQIVERLVGQHDAPAECVIRLVALDDNNLVRRIAQLHRDREIETGRATTKTSNSHFPHLQTGFH